jgi:hypothetical protein
MRPRKLVQDAEIERVITLAQRLGLPIGPIEVSTTSVTIHPPANRELGAYEKYKKASEAGDRNSHRRQA